MLPACLLLQTLQLHVISIIVFVYVLHFMPFCFCVDIVFLIFVLSYQWIMLALKEEVIQVQLCVKIGTSVRDGTECQYHNLKA